MPNDFKEYITFSDTGTYPYIFEQNVRIALKGDGLSVRANICRPKTHKPVPVLATLGPHGEHILYAVYVSPL